MTGFDFSNYNRNVALHAKGVPLPKATSTGTTIVGCIYDKGVVVSLSRRAVKDNIGAPAESLSAFKHACLKIDI
jgi:20S proteasome subunit beta 2